LAQDELVHHSNDVEAELLASLPGISIELVGRLTPGPQIVLSDSDRRLLVHALGTELQHSGFDKDWRPTRRGLVIESLIDSVTGC